MQGIPAFTAQGRQKLHAALAHLSGLVQRDADRQERDEQNAHRVIVILVYDPQGDAEQLEHVEGVENLEGNGERGWERKTRRWVNNELSNSPLGTAVACRI